MSFFKKIYSRNVLMFLLIASAAFCATEPIATPPQQQNKATLVSLTTLFGGLLGAGLPQNSLAQILRMRGYFLSLMTAQTAAGVAAAQPLRVLPTMQIKKSVLLQLPMAFTIYHL